MAKFPNFLVKAAIWRASIRRSNALPHYLFLILVSFQLDRQRSQHFSEDKALRLLWAFTSFLHFSTRARSMSYNQAGVWRHLLRFYRPRRLDEKEALSPPGFICIRWKTLSQMVVIVLVNRVVRSFFLCFSLSLTQCATYFSYPYSLNRAHKWLMPEQPPDSTLSSVASHCVDW
ncbi:hypothetical protein CSUI_000807 [Cystoisospora suis]|uniref:Uncharacterized protein n=1 Tax=Cystoisospora suis TaxID=483139 RepID=A0A2C6LE45_9APIC|nr:hypothetical protein CSUI_000807 [Cystoisospora suis]